MLRAKVKTLPKTLPPVHPNLGTQQIFKRKLLKLIKEMQDSIEYWISASYKANTPLITADELPAAALNRALKKLFRRWSRQFDELAPALAEYYTKSANNRSAKQLAAILNEHGMSVKFKMTREMRDVMKATIEEQVGLIKSIPEQHFKNVQGAVMRSVSAGRDLKSLTDDLKKIKGVTERRAAAISRDQNNKATATMVRVRQQELGITQAIWIHSHGGKVPRPSHLANNGKKYDVAKGWYDPDEGRFVHPGELINCRCVSRSIIPGFD